MRIALFGLLIALTTVTCQAKDIPEDSKPTYGGTLIWGTHTEPTIINPILTTHTISASLLRLICNSLVRINSRGEVEPDLAESWEVSPDGLTYTFHLRKGVRFHDGKECTAYDAEFTFHKIMDPEVDSPYRESFEQAEDFKAIDKYTFHVKLKEPQAAFIYGLTREIAPRHLLENVDLKDCAFNHHPIGTGPFKFKEWKDSQIILEYNPDYYEGRPYLDKIITRTFPSISDAWIALMRSEVDFVVFIEREDYEVARNDGAFKTYAFPIDSYYEISYNPDDFLFADTRIRKAISYGIDRKSLIDQVAGGYGLDCNGPFYPGSLGYNPDIKPFEYNPQMAMELLAEAGWQEKNEDGILEKDGRPLEIKILVDERRDIFKRIAMLIRQQLQELGIKIIIQLYNNETMLTSDYLRENQIQAHLNLFLGGIDPDQQAEDWYCKKLQRSDKIWIYHNRDVDRLFEAGRRTIDTKEREAIYRKIHQLIYEDQPVCFLFFPYSFYAVSSKVANTDSYFTINLPNYLIKDWYIVQFPKPKFAGKIQN